MKKLVIATRRSRLALWQAEHIAGRLRKLDHGLQVELLAMCSACHSARRLRRVAMTSLFMSPGRAPTAIAGG